jgi:hypothetical protein
VSCGDVGDELDVATVYGDGLAGAKGADCHGYIVGRIDFEILFHRE